MGPILWLILVAVLLIMEAMTTALTTIWFAGGALVAAAAAWFGASLTVQLLLFFIVAVLLLIFTRPWAVKYLNKGVSSTNVNSLIGKTAVVTQEINNLEQTGQVRIHDIEWMARTDVDGIVISEKTIVEILEVHGVKLIVKECHKEG